MGRKNPVLQISGISVLIAASGQKAILELKSLVTETKNSLQKFKRRFEKAKESVNLEERTLEIMESEK